MEQPTTLSENSLREWVVLARHFRLPPFLYEDLPVDFGRSKRSPQSVFDVVRRLEVRGQVITHKVRSFERGTVVLPTKAGERAYYDQLVAGELWESSPGPRDLFVFAAAIHYGEWGVARSLRPRLSLLSDQIEDLRVWLADNSDRLKIDPWLPRKYPLLALSWLEWLNEKDRSPEEVRDVLDLVRQRRLRAEETPWSLRNNPVDKLAIQTAATWDPQRLMTRLKERLELEDMLPSMEQEDEV